MKSEKYESDAHFQNKIVNGFLVLHSRACTRVIFKLRYLKIKRVKMKKYQLKEKRK